jgi:predicted AlkP superfamily phosphohydrolase/phosphomutase
MDDLVGQVLGKMNKKDGLVIMSDHGFKLFCRGFNLNSWLYLNGYLSLKDGKNSSGEWFQDVDWSQTRAYGLGLGGIYINQEGREAQGIVKPGPETQALKAELQEKLSRLVDPDTGDIAIRHLYDRDELPAGPFKGNCPDFIMGYNEGYRVSWASVSGKVNREVFEDNTKAWSGDHCIDPELVPGVFFSNLPITTATPSIVDIAPTALSLFGVDVPAHMDGASLVDPDALQSAPQKNATIGQDSKR